MLKSLLKDVVAYFLLSMMVACCILGPFSAIYALSFVIFADENIAWNCAFTVFKMVFYTGLAIGAAFVWIWMIGGIQTVESGSEEAALKESIDLKVYKEKLKQSSSRPQLPEMPSDVERSPPGTLVNLGHFDSANIKIEIEEEKRARREENERFLKRWEEERAMMELFPSYPSIKQEPAPEPASEPNEIPSPFLDFKSQHGF